MTYTTPDPTNVYFFWEGEISEKRMAILRDSVYSTRVYNPLRRIYVISNSLKQDQFEDVFRIEVTKWDKSWFDKPPVSQRIIDAYENVGPRQFSDFFRLILLYKFGGSYIDTDDICIKEMSWTPNIVCRSLDAHTAYYNGVEAKDCIPGKFREIRGYDHINFFPRNDCFQNWAARHAFFSIGIFQNESFLETPHPLDIVGSRVSFQSIINETCIRYQNFIDQNYGAGFHTHLTLLYLYEDWLARCSMYDLGDVGGEMHDEYAHFEHIREVEWGTLKVSESEARLFFERLKNKYPSLSHLWLHSKEQEPEYFIKLDKNEKYYPSAWAYHWVKQDIEEFRRNA